MKDFLFFLSCLVLGALFVYFVVYKTAFSTSPKQGSREYCELFSNRPEEATPESCK